MVGQRVGRFTIVAKLGEGGMGAVWKAEDDVLRRIVALKFLPDHLVGSSEARERFLREARAASSLDDARLATVHDFGEHEGRQFIAAEFVDGKTLHDMIASGPLPLADAVRIVADAAEELEHAHARGVIHRDITERNIMCSATAVPRSSISASRRLRHVAHLVVSTTVGTLGTWPPGAGRGRAIAARRLQLGVVLYELTTGVLPLPTRSTSAVYATMQEARASGSGGPRCRALGPIAGVVEGAGPTPSERSGIRA
jgi:serine/threonine-protein kinase